MSHSCEKRLDMFLYQFDNKSIDLKSSRGSPLRGLKRTTSSSLSHNNKKFLRDLGFQVRELKKKSNKK